MFDSLTGMNGRFAITGRSEGASTAEVWLGLKSRIELSVGEIGFKSGFVTVYRVPSFGM